jgi:transcriptional regulator with XRE-family HTH domain
MEGENPDVDAALRGAASLLRSLRLDRKISLRQLADGAGVNPSVAQRAENGSDARLRTWARLFGALGYRLRLDAQETAEDLADFLEDEAGRRHDLAGLCSARRRWY